MAQQLTTILRKNVSGDLRKLKPLYLMSDRFFSNKPSKFTDGPIDPEINFHSNLAENWWDMKTVRPLHFLNEVRVPFIVSGLNQAKSKPAISSDQSRLLEGYDILDVGCGGGILTEALGRLKGNVIGLDPSSDLIKVARNHAEKYHQSQYCLRYEVDNIHNFCLNNKNKFDAVVVSEVIEHIDNKEKFLSDCVTCLKSHGSIFLTTPNKTFIANIFVIKLAERFGIIPCGTHDYEKFINPDDLTALLQKLNCSVRRIEGIRYNPFNGKFSMSKNRLLMYALHAQKIA